MKSYYVSYPFSCNCLALLITLKYKNSVLIVFCLRIRRVQFTDHFRLIQYLNSPTKRSNQTYFLNILDIFPYNVGVDNYCLVVVRKGSHTYGPFPQLNYFHKPFILLISATEEKGKSHMWHTHPSIGRFFSFLGRMSSVQLSSYRPEIDTGINSSLIGCLKGAFGQTTCEVVPCSSSLL